jgi:hypothetical protein
LLRFLGLRVALQRVVFIRRIEMRTTGQDEIVETRIWIGSVEIVSRVNWTHIARVRRSLGFAGELGCLADWKQFKLAQPARIAVMRSWRRAGRRAA